MIGARGKGWIGVDVGSHSVKLVQVERSGGRIQICDALVIRRREPWEDSTSTEPPVAESGEEIRAAMALGDGFTGKNAAVNLTMSVCDIRPLTVPEGTPAERRELVERELSQLSGSAIGSREIDFWSLDFGDDKQASAENVLAASVSSDWSQQVAKDLSAAHLVGNVLDVLPLSLARALELGAPGCSRNKAIAAVDWGYRRATLCIVLDGTPVFVRCLRDSGFAAVIDALSRSLSVTSEEAQKLLTDHGLPAEETPGDDLQAIIAEVAAQSLEVFGEELDRTITFLQQQRRALVPQQIVLFGGGASVRNAAPFLASKVDVPVSTWELDGQDRTADRRIPPLPLLGPAIALSALAWE